MPPLVKTVKVWRSGHITIPKAIREYMGVAPGDWISMRVVDGSKLEIKRMDAPSDEQRRRARK